MSDVVSWLIAFGVSFVLSLLFALILKGSTLIFIIFWNIFIALFVYAGMIPLWCMFISLIVMIFLFYYNYTSDKGNG